VQLGNNGGSFSGAGSTPRSFKPDVPYFGPARGYPAWSELSLEGLEEPFSAGLNFDGCRAERANGRAGTATARNATLLYRRNCACPKNREKVELKIANLPFVPS
jgi:hypothetical protein